MWMTEELQVLDFSFNTAGHVPTDELLASYNLESHLLSRALVDSKPNFAKGALAQRSHNLVGADALLRLGFVLVRGRLHGIVATCTGLGRLYGIVATVVSVLLLWRLLLWRRRLLLGAANVGRGQGNSELLIIEASSTRHGGGDEGGEDGRWGDTGGVE